MVQQQYGCLSEAGTMTMPTVVLMQKGEISQGPAPRPRPTAMAAQRGESLSQGGVP